MAENFDRKYFVFKVSLEGSNPLIWRRIHMLPFSTFYEFGGIIENSFGWEGDLHHLHKLEMENPTTGKAVLILPHKDIPGQKIWFSGELIDEENAEIGKYFSSTNRKAVHTYDFTSNWRHIIQLEEINELNDDDDIEVDCCVDGEELAPPEDCGGIRRYYRLSKILKDPNHRKHAEMKKWILRKKNGADILAGAKFDPKKIDDDSCSIM